MKRIILAVLVLGSLAAGSAAQIPIEEVTELVPHNSKTPVWAMMCRSTFCKTNVCLMIKDRRGNSARAEVHSEGSFGRDKRVVAAGRYCSPSWNMTYFMMYTVYVTPLDGDAIVTYKQIKED